MMRVAIVGYGNLGRKVEETIREQPDMELVGVFSRRDLDIAAPVLRLEDAESLKGDIDVVFLCLGSATDMPEQAAKWAGLFTTVDTYDNHSQMASHRADMDAAARAGGHVAVYGAGWDPGLFSLNRTIGLALFPQARQATFWGPGISQGHSDAVRRIAGVRQAVQYTRPRPEAVEAAKKGQEITGSAAHTRHCFVVADEADHERIRREITEMPAYFAPYETHVEFISEAEFEANHRGMPHGGKVITSGNAGGEAATAEFALELESNPGFTAAVQVAYGRAAARLAQQGATGAYSVLEIAPYLISPAALDELIVRDV